MSFKFNVNLYENESGITLAFCDLEISNIDLKFYKGNVMEKEELIELIKRVYNRLISINALGEKSVKLLIDLELASDKDVRFFKGIPHLIVFFI